MRASVTICRCFRALPPTKPVARSAPSTRDRRRRTPLRELSITIPSSLTRPDPSRAGPRAAPDIDPAVHCSACDAVCCRLTVVLLPGDDVPERFTAWTDEGLHVMARDEDGWCVALDGARLCCSIYDSRPAICRKFAMGGPYCRAVRADYAAQDPRAISLVLC